VHQPGLFLRVQDQQEYYESDNRTAAARNLQGAAAAASAPVPDLGSLRKSLPALTENLILSLPTGGDFFEQS